MKRSAWDCAGTSLASMKHPTAWLSLKKAGWTKRRRVKYPVLDGNLRAGRCRLAGPDSMKPAWQRTFTEHKDHGGADRMRAACQLNGIAKLGSRFLWSENGSFFELLGSRPTDCKNAQFLLTDIFTKEKYLMILRVQEQ